MKFERIQDKASIKKDNVPRRQQNGMKRKTNKIKKNGKKSMTIIYSQ